MTQLEKNIALNLKRIRKAKNMSLDMLSEQTGVSKSMLGQIERGESNPTVATIGKIVEGLKIPIEKLIYDKQEVIVIPSLETATVCKEQEGAYQVQVLLPYEADRSFEVYLGRLQGGAVMISNSHGEDTGEYLTVLQGSITLQLEQEQFTITENNALYFACDRMHSYRNTGDQEAVVSMIISRERK